MCQSLSIVSVADSSTRSLIIQVGSATGEVALFRLGPWVVAELLFGSHLERVEAERLTPAQVVDLLVSGVIVNGGVS